MRQYTTEEIRQMYEARELLEGGAARAAARAATDADITRLQMILQQAESEVGNYGSKRWGDLDHAFHAALADASHNERIARGLKLLLTECHYVLFLFIPRKGRAKPATADATAHMQSVLNDHREVLSAVAAGNVEAAEQTAREHMRRSCSRITQLQIARDLPR